MQLIPQIPTKTLQLGHLRQNLVRKDVDVFKANLSTLLQRVEIAENNNEREDNMKNLVLDFLKDTYYKGTNEINTKGNYDLVIHQDLSANSPVSVIVEVKRPSNNSEMISVQNPNTKALQELLHYFLQESFIKGNKEVKYLIITNIYEWYIFDAAIFEKIFFENKSFIKKYKEWNDKKLGIYKTDWLYNELLKPFIENELGEISCAYFDLKDYQEIVEKTDEEEDKKLISLYKIFSPAHLLKYSFANDANTLNKEFYFELLHILGLEENRKDGKHLIQRQSPKNRNIGSLLENTILALENKMLFGKKKFFLGKDLSLEEEKFSFTLELCITWLNRVLFLKLLEGQLIKYHQKRQKATNSFQKRDIAFLNIEKIKDFDELNELFFEVLAVPIQKRSRLVIDKFGNLPYLNSSLFDSTDLEIELFFINVLKNRLEIPIYNATVLKDGKGNKISGNKNTLQYLFEFLDAYDFSSEAGVEIQPESKTLINAAVLGLIFEKINGYQDGSFFTPSYITMYMCKEVVEKAAIRKFNEKYGWNCADIASLSNYIDKIDRKEASKVANSIKICDPAVGSGHFLVSILNEIIVLKHKLGILLDKNGLRLREYTIHIENDELIIADKDEKDLFYYYYNNEDSQNVQETIFHEKQTIIENCLFGVDINPKSVAICRLRLWIELLKNMYYILPTPVSKTKRIEITDLELQTLPNIDINIKCGNSLISRFALGNGQNLLPKDRIFVKKLIDDYKTQVFAYKSVKIWQQKSIIIEQIARIKAELEKFVVPNDKDFAELRKKEAELGQISFAFDAQEREKQVKLAEEVTFLRKKYVEKLQTLYSNSLEWRFDFPEILDEEGHFEGFDAVVGNPPYFSLAKDSRNSYYRENYATFNTAGDIYCLFYELASKLLKKKGIAAFITSNSWMRANYGQELRNYLLTETNPYLLFDFSWFQVFPNASVDTNILFFTNEMYDNQLVGVVANRDFTPKEISYYGNTYRHKLNFTENEYWNITNEKSQKLKAKLASKGKKLAEWDFVINYGIKTGLNEAFHINEKIYKELIIKDSKNQEILVPLLRGRDIERYGYNFAQLYLINSYNGFMQEIKEPEKNIQKMKDGFFKYKVEGKSKWQIAKRIEHSRGNQFRINRVVVEEDYPFVYEYLKKYENELKDREDKGEHWTNLRDCKYNLVFSQEKLVWAETMRVHITGNRSFPRFGFDKNEFYTDKTAFIGTGKNIKYLLAILNSRVGKWLIQEYVSKLDTGAYMMQKSYLGEIPIFEASEIEMKEIMKLMDKILAKKGKDCSDLEAQIDALVYKLYDLTEEEIGIIEERNT